MAPATSSDDGLAVPIDPDARRGAGVRLGISLGGGGLYFIAWQVAYLDELASAGIDVAGADRLVGTSAGSVVSSMLAAGSLGRLHTAARLLAKVPRVVAAMAPAGALSPSQTRALELFGAARTADPDKVREIGHAALAAGGPPPGRMARALTVVMGRRSWPSPALQLTCVDAFTGERCVMTADSGVPLPRAAAASSAVPGLFAPQPVRDRRCMDGGVSGTGTHLDLLAGARRAFVLSLTDGSMVGEGGMTVAPGAVEADLEALRSSGTEVWMRCPAPVDIDRLMSPAAVSEALTAGRAAARRDTTELRSFLA